MKLEKEVNKVIESLQHMRKEIATLEKGGTKISVHETVQPGPTKVTLHHSKNILNNSRSISPKKEGSFADSKIGVDKSGIKRLSKSPSNIQQKPDDRKEETTKYQGIVRTLLGQLVNNTVSTKETTMSVEDFMKTLIPTKNAVDKNSLSQHHHNSSMGDMPEDTHHKKLSSLFSDLTKRLIELAALPKQAYKTSHPNQESKAVQTDSFTCKTMHFSNINLSKAIEEFIKKVIIESPLVKYTPNNLTEYFETLVLVDKDGDKSISDMQKQALFVSIYSLLQRQLLVEVTLEMIKDSGVNVQNLFQYTFSRMGLDYEKYVQFENNRDQDLSAQPVFKGDLDCTLDGDEASHRNMILDRRGRIGNFFPLDFTKIQQTMTQEQTTEKSEAAQSTKR